MQKSIYRLAILALCIGFLVHSASAMILSQGNIGGSTNINSDMQLLGYGKLGGGGHANWEITGEAAQRLREKAIIRYDTNGDGLLQKEELYPGPGSESSANLGFLSAVEFFSENTEYAGARIYGARPLSRDEGPDGWIKDIEGLLEVPASSTEPIRIRLLFSSDMAESMDQNVPLLSSVLADAVYRPFSTGGFLAADQSSYSHRDLTRMVPNTFWHQASGPTRVHNGTYSWRCGYPLNNTYPAGLADAMDASVNLTGAVNPQLSFWTKLMIGPGDRAEVMVKNRTSASWDVMDTYNSNIVGSTGTGYIMQSYDLSPYSGNIIDIRFLFTSDHAGTAEGWYLDDMMIGEFGPGIIFEDDFENPLSNIWHTTGWGRDNSTAHHGNWSLADSPGANYTSNSTSNALLGPIYFGGADSANLEFWYLAEIADIGDVFSLSASSDNSTWETLFSTNQSAAAWTQVQDLSLDDYLGGLYLNFSFSANETGEAGGIDLDGLMITATYPTYWSQDAEDFVGITLIGDVDHSEDLWSHDEGVWSCNSPATGRYLAGMDNELLVQPSLDWRFLENVSISFQYSGELNPGARMHVEMTAAQSINPTSWTTVATIDPSQMDSDSTRWTDFVLDEWISQFIGQRYVRLRFRFQSDPGASTAMGISLRNIAVNGIVYDGFYSMSHTHFQVSVSSFYDPQITQGSYFILRTPFGEIFTYSVTLQAGEESTDAIKFASFNIMENPQFLFILFLLFSGLILHFPKRYFKEYKISMPYRYRILAKKAVVPTALSKSSVLAMAIFYFVPSLGGFLFVSGIVYIIIGAVLVLVSAAVSNFVYKAKMKEDGEMIPPERKEAKPSPPPAPSTPIINVNVPEAKKRKKVAKKRAAPTKDQREYQCQTCGEIFTMPLDWHDDARCPACGSPASSDEIANEKDAPLVEEIEAYVSKVECPECAAIIPVEGDERFEVDCPTCGKPLAILPKKLEPGYNYLFLDEEEKNTYRFFSSLLDGRKGLVLTTSFPEKVRREHPLGDSSIIWITDTSSEFGSSMDPRRLDFEVTRAISEVTSGEEEGVILLDGLEYLIVENGFEPVLRFIKKITDIASMDEATLLVLADPETISSDDLSVLKKEFDFVEDFKNLPEDEDVF